MYVCNCNGITEAQVKAGVKVEPHPRCKRCVREAKKIREHNPPGDELLGNESGPDYGT